MCYNPVTIVNPCKYVDVHRRDRFLLQVPCGQCAECQKAKSREWNYRTYYEFIRLFEESTSGFCYFDTLTYSDGNLPHMSDLLPELPHVPCFRTKDAQDFLKRLRINLSRKFGITDDAFSYFLCSEYGAFRGRPHYHMLLFFRKKIDPIKLSLLVSQSWNLGRTDGVPYKTPFYVNYHNVIKTSRLGDVLACAKYVTKYVEKDCKLQSIIDKRIKYADMILSSDEFPYKKRGSVARRKMLTKIAGEVNQFHLQSLHFGELALRDFDMNELVKTGCLRMPSHQVISLVPLPDYYARKLFYSKYKLQGNYCWQLNELGKEYKNKRLPYLAKQIKQRFDALNLLANSNYNTDVLTDYVLNLRGRYRGELNESTIEERLDSITHYVYKTQSDKETVGVGVSTEYLGNSKVGYSPFSSDIIKIKDFIGKYVYLNDELENQLKTLYQSTIDINVQSQLYYSRLQELQATFKSLSY